jgi:hypothetical protein
MPGFLDQMEKNGEESKIAERQREGKCERQSIAGGEG